MATIRSSALAQNLEQLVVAFVRSSQELVLAAVTQAMLAPSSSAAPTTKRSKRGKTSKPEAHVAFGTGPSSAARARLRREPGSRR